MEHKYPEIVESYDATLKSEGIKRTVFIISISDGVFADVMSMSDPDDSDHKYSVQRTDGTASLCNDYQYVMENAGGGTAYYKDSEGSPAGNVEDYGFSESDLLYLT